MARNRKQTVDYYPHYVDHGKTVYILEERYGNDGYALWFKLLERLGATDGHCIDFNDGAEWEFFVSKTHAEEDKCTEMMDMLAKLGAIDRELWKKRYVWCQNFVDGLSVVYQKRHTEIPAKPNFCNENIGIATISEPETIAPSRESRVEESKVEKGNEKSTPPDGSDFSLSHNLTCKRNKKTVRGSRYGKNVILADGELEQMIAEWGIDFTRNAIREYDMLFPNRPAIRKHTDHNLGIRDYVNRGYICSGKIKAPKNAYTQPPHKPTEEELGTAEERAAAIRNNLPFRLKRGSEVSEPEQVGDIVTQMAGGP